MTITIKEDKEINSKIHNFIADTVKEYGYLVVKFDFNIEVEKLNRGGKN